MNFITSLFSLDGRASRQEFWSVTLGVTIIDVILNLVWAITDQDLRLGRLAQAWLLPAILLGVAVQVRRWHDLDRSGAFVLVNVAGALWMALVAFLAPRVDGQSTGVILLLNLIPLGAFLWTFLLLGCEPGSPDRNQFGENPLG